jgi:hypothetical protein
MPINPDQVRVDLLRIKRKLYISYPEGSKERQEFLLASKLSELGYLQKMISPDIVDLVFDEYKKQQRAETINIATSFLSGACLTVMLLGFHQLHPTNLWLMAFPLPAFVGMLVGFTHVFHAIDHWKSMKPFKAEYEKISEKIERILKEITELSKK